MVDYRKLITKPYMASLVVNNLYKSYERKKRPPLEAVKGISFDVRPGECFGLLGPNGAGKSTTMKCVTGFYKPNSGNIEVLKKDITSDPRLARQHLGVCHQDDTLDTDFSMLDQLLQFASFFRIPKKEALFRAEKLIRRFDLYDRKNDLVESLSGGLRRRLQVARSLINEPKLLVLDEPTTGLDPESRRSLWDILVEERQKGLAILLSTHYMDEAQRLCDRIAIIFKGKIVACDNPQKLIKDITGNKIVKEEIRPGIIIERASNLEDVYLKLTGVSLAADLSEGESG
jgi:lipooligosaccharide transport system ATP-binding protein